ncbi:MAG: hypothetical protein ABIP46_13055 [Polaromonas sp.]
MTLRYLHFDYAEDTEGHGTLEAMASTWPEQAAAVQAEIVQVLDWAHTGFQGRCGPLHEGGDWDFDLQGQQEFTGPETLHYDPEARQLSVVAGPPEKPRHMVTLCLSGSAEFCAAFMQQFGLDTES